MLTGVASFLGIANAGRALAFAFFLAALAGAGGVYVGMEWEQGRQAQSDNRVLRADVDALASAAAELRQRGVDIAQDFRTAQRQLEAISHEHEQRDRASRTFYGKQRDALEQLLATHPGIAACRIGDAGVQHWNASARGAAGAAAGSTAEPAVAPAAAVPGGAADAARGQRRSDSAGVGRSGEAVPRLRERKDGTRPGGDGV